MAGRFEHAELAARIDLDEATALEHPVHQVDIVGERVHHRRRVRIALEHRERLRARIEHARGAAGERAEAALHELLLGDLVALLVAPAVANPHLAAGPPQCRQHLIGLAHRERDRLLDQHRLAPLDRGQHGSDVLALAGGDDHRRHGGIVDDRQVVVAMRAAAYQRRKLRRVRGVEIGDRDARDGRVPGGEARAQRADAAGADDAETDLARPRGFRHVRHSMFARARAVSGRCRL